LLLCVFFGAALGNVVRGVPVDASAWASRLESSTDPPSSLASPRYSLSWMHGGLWVQFKTTQRQLYLFIVMWQTR
jgi:cytochrome bd-type quinol oxidase subunit 2